MSSTSGIGGKRSDPAGFRPVGTGVGDPRTRQRPAGPVQADAVPGRRERVHRDRQFVMVEGRQLDRTAPRGTYLDILV